MWHLTFDSVENRKSEHHYWILNTWISLGTKFQFHLIIYFLDKICPKRALLVENKKMNIIVKLCIFEYVLVSNFNLRLYWRLSKISKTSKNLYKIIFWYLKLCIFWKCIQCVIHGDKTQMIKKISFGQNRWYKKYPLFCFASFNS